MLAGCVTLQEGFTAAPSFAFDRPEETTLGRAAEPLQARHPGLSGYRLIQGGVAALMTRAARADLAEHSIDAQYYVYEPDAAGAFLLERRGAAGARSPGPPKGARSLSEISRTLSDTRRRAQKEVVMVMAYYVPGKRGVEVVSELVARGVREWMANRSG